MIVLCYSTPRRKEEEIVVPVRDGVDKIFICGNQNPQKSGRILNPELIQDRFHSPPRLLLCPLSLQIPPVMATKVITLEELRDHTTKDSIWVLLHGKGPYPRYTDVSNRLTIFRSV